MKGQTNLRRRTKRGEAQIQKEQSTLPVTGSEERDHGYLELTAQREAERKARGCVRSGIQYVSGAVTERCRRLRDGNGKVIGSFVFIIFTIIVLMLMKMQPTKPIHDQLIQSTTNPTNATQGKLMTSDACWDFMVEKQIEIPKTRTDYAKWREPNWGICSLNERLQWQTSDCERTLKLYDVKSYGPHDTLPRFITTPILQPRDLDHLHRILQHVVRHLERLNIPHVMLFGTALGIERFGRMMPWDDDIDMAIDKSFQEVFTNGLREKSNSPWCPKSFFSWFLSSPKCKIWILNETEQIDIVWKDWGMPFKIIRQNKRLPNVDINTYTVANGNITITPRELKSGHIHEFSVQKELVLPTRKVNMTVGNGTVSVPMPSDSKAVLKLLYGDNALETCITSHSHGSICKERGFCENPMANHLPRTTFPCSLLLKTKDEQEK